MNAASGMAGDATARRYLQDVPECRHPSASPQSQHRGARAELLTNPSSWTSVLILHNHPSGDPVPSPEDMELTRRLAAAGVLMGIDVIDHVVLGDVRYWSFKEAGRL